MASGDCGSSDQCFASRFNGNVRIFSENGRIPLKRKYRPIQREIIERRATNGNATILFGAVRREVEDGGGTAQACVGDFQAALQSLARSVAAQIPQRKGVTPG
jgi:hypothetical protein